MTIIEICYNLANAIVGFAFIPQILTLVRKPSRNDKSLNITTCSMFMLCSVAMLAYASAQVNDLYFTISALVNVTGWMLITLLATYNRYFRREPIHRDDFMVGL